MLYFLCESCQIMKNWKQTEKLESLLNWICKPHLLYYLTTEQSHSLFSSWILHSVAFTLQIKVSGVYLKIIMLPIIHYSLIIIVSLSSPGYLSVCLFFLCPLSCLSLWVSSSFMFFSSAKKLFFTVCHTGSWAPWTKVAAGHSKVWGTKGPGRPTWAATPFQWPQHTAVSLATAMIEDEQA